MIDNITANNTSNTYTTTTNYPTLNQIIDDCITASDYTINWSNWRDAVAIDTTTTKPKEELTMNNNFNFGVYNNANVRLSTYGMAIKNKSGTWVAYDKEQDTLMNVDILNVELKHPIFYKIPKAVSAVCKGDIVLHNDTPVFVNEVKDNKFVVVNPYEGIEQTIFALKSPFGYSYIPVIISITDFNPCGNLLPSLTDNPLLTLLLANNGQTSIADFDPTLLALCSGDSANILPLLFMLKGKK